jgi:hypothetical protein
MSTRRTARIVLLALLVVALAGLATTATWAATRASGWPPAGCTGPWGGPDRDDDGPGMMDDHGNGPGMMGGPAMMGESEYSLAGNGQPVDSMPAARTRAQAFADRLDLRVGEIMQFDNGFYAELLTTTGQGGTEVLIDQANGGVALEYGPAMMWNTGYGMHTGSPATPARISASQATTIAQHWLDAHRSDLTVGEPDPFPGYYTLHTLHDENIVSMMSVNAHTGTVWYHTWHGQFVAMSDE